MYRDLSSEVSTPSQHVGGSNKRNVYDFRGAGKKVLSLSEPASHRRLQKKTNNVNFASAHPPYRGRKPTTLNGCNDNEDLVTYLKQFEDVDTGHSHSMPVLQTNSDTIHRQQCEAYKYSSQTFPKESYYQTCFMSRDVDIAAEEEYELSSPSYLHYTLGYPMNYSEMDASTPKTINVQDISSLQPPKRKFIDGTHCLLESFRKNNRGISVDTSSALSSETDSDFTFYPCSRQYHEVHGFEPVDFVNRICGLPSQLEDPDSPCPPLRQVLGENSLEDFSRQFYLEDDALSDDVFVDDYSYLRGDVDYGCRDSCCQSWSQCRNTPIDANIRCQLEHMTIMDTPPTTGSNLNKYFMENESSCRSMAYNSWKEQSHSLTLIYKESENEKRSSKSSVKSNGMIKVDVQINDATPSRIIQERKKISDSEFEEFDLSEYNLNLANAFDSLRRNSMQTKSRKLWKERRTRMRRSTLFNLKTSTVFTDRRNANETSNDNDRPRTNSGSLPCGYSIHKSSQNVHCKNGENAKPLRGILKNKNDVYPPVFTGQTTSHCPNMQDAGLYEYHDNDISSGTDNRGRICCKDNGITSSTDNRGHIICCKDNDIPSGSDNRGHKCCKDNNITSGTDNRGHISCKDNEMPSGTDNRGHIICRKDNDITPRNEDKTQHPSLMEQPLKSSYNKNNADKDNNTPYIGYSLDSRGKSRRKKALKPSRILSSPPLQRRQRDINNKNDVLSYSPTFVSVGVQVNLLD